MCVWNSLHIRTIRTFFLSLSKKMMWTRDMEFTLRNCGTCCLINSYIHTVAHKFLSMVTGQRSYPQECPNYWHYKMKTLCWYLSNQDVASPPHDSIIPSNVINCDFHMHAISRWSCIFYDAKRSSSQVQSIS